MNYSDPFGLCVKEDINCANLVRMLRSHGGSAFQRAANRYDGMRQGRLFFTAKSETTNRYGSNPNTDGDPETFLGGWTQLLGKGEGNVVLVGDFSTADFLVFAVHEADHVATGSGDERSAWGQSEEAFSQLSGAERAQAKYNSDALNHRTNGRVGSHLNTEKEKKAGQ